MEQMNGETNQSGDCGRERINFKLDDKTRAEVRELAREAGCSMFEMCVILIKERIKWTPKRRFLPCADRKMSAPFPTVRQPPTGQKAQLML